MSRLITRIPLGHIPKKRTHWCLNWRHILNGLEFTTPSPRSGFTLLFGNIVIVFSFFVFSSPVWYIRSLVLYYEGFCDLFYFIFRFCRFISPQRSIRILRCWIFCVLQLNCRSWCTSRALVRMLPSDLTISTDGFAVKIMAFMSQLLKGWKCLPLPEKSVPRGKVSVKPTRLYNE